MKSVHDIEFKQYGRVLDVDTAEFVATMKAKEAIKEGRISYLRYVFKPI